MAKGVPTARSKRYRATHKAKEKIISTSSTSSNDVLPLLISILEKPITQAEGAQRAISTVQVLHQALLHATSPGTHPYALLQVMASYIFDWSKWSSESKVRNMTLQQQLDDCNAKLLEQFNVQNAEILNLQEQLKKSQAAQDFTTDKFCKLIWFRLVVAIALFQQTMTLLFRPLRFINIAFGLRYIQLCDRAWSGYSSN
jgi:hypothetical protein